MEDEDPCMITLEEYINLEEQPFDVVLESGKFSGYTCTCVQLLKCEWAICVKLILSFKWFICKGDCTVLLKGCVSLAELLFHMHDLFDEYRFYPSSPVAWIQTTN